VDAPATIARMHDNPDDPMRHAIAQYDAILTYGGGPEIENAYRKLGARAYYSIYNGLDVDTHHPVPAVPDLKCDVAFIGNRLPDREKRVEDLFLKAAELAPDKQFLLGGEGWGDKAMPPNVRWIGHVPTHRHNSVNCSAGMVMNINRSSMAAYGYAPPTRVFEVAGAGACMLCDEWPGIEHFFEPGTEIIVIDSPEEVVAAISLHDEAARKHIGEAFHARALRDHTYAQRAKDAERAFRECLQRKNRSLAQSEHTATAMTGEVA
jgi:spore maturation protein CgeB